MSWPSETVVIAASPADDVSLEAVKKEAQNRNLSNNDYKIIKTAQCYCLVRR